MVALSPLTAAASGRARAATPPQSGAAALLGSFAGYNAMTGAPLPGSDGSLAQDLSNRLYTAVSKAWGGGAAPQLHFVPSITPSNGQAEVHLSAAPTANEINLDPYAMAALVYNSNPAHSGAVNQMPHEMAHLHQLADVLASIPDREGGAQAFADAVEPLAAAAARTPYDTSRNFDGDYTQFVQQVLAQKGRDWVLGGQFGHPPVSWP